MEQGGKRGVAVWHRRAGKDDLCLHYAATAAMQKPAMYWHMLPEATQARKAIWEAVNPHTGLLRIDEAFPHAIRSRTRNQEMAITFINGSTWQVVGSDNYNSLIGTPPYGLIFSEFAVADPKAWAYLRPILAENGGWAFFIYTPRGENHGKKLYDASVTREDWFSELLTVEETNVFDEKTLDQEKQELIDEYGETRGIALFNQEYYCSFYEAFDGKVVYPDFSRKLHVADQKLLPFAKEGVKAGREIIRGWDNTGLSPACIVCYINTSGVLYVLKEFCGEDIGIIDFSMEVLRWCEDEFGQAEFRDIGDPGGRIRDSQKKSPAMYMREELGLILEDGIQTFKVRRESVTGRLTRIYKGVAAMQIDIDCAVTIAGFEGGYHFPEIGKTGYYHPEPKKNKFSHIHDALQYLCTIMFTIYNSTENEYNEYRDNYTEGRSKYGGY